MRHRAPLAVAVALVAVFAVIAISVVQARDPIDRQVEDSFEATMARLSSRAATADTLGCRKASLYYYDCAASVRIRGRLGQSAVRYRLWLKDDGCWTTTSKPAGPLPARFLRPSGCID